MIRGFGAAVPQMMVPGAPGCPSPMGAPMPGRIEAFIAEVLKVSQADIRGVGIALQGQLSSTVLTTTDLYRVPSDQEMVVLQAAGYVEFTSLNTEPTAILNYLNLDPSERLLVKAQNCSLQLEDTDRSLQAYDARSIPLGAITPPMGAPQFFPVDAPFLIAAGHTLQATFTLVDPTAAIVGNATNYGVLLTGALIPKRQ